MHTGPLTPAPAQSAIKGTALVHADFIVTGVVMTMLGPMLPMFSARWLLNDAQAGYLFVAQFATSMLGMLLSGFLVERLGYRRTLRIGLVLMAAGMAMLVRANWSLGLVFNRVPQRKGGYYYYYYYYYGGYYDDTPDDGRSRKKGRRRANGRDSAAIVRADHPDDET